jgi:hypothetical protein
MIQKFQPNQSPGPTAVSAVSSAVAVHVASWRWLSWSLGIIKRMRQLSPSETVEVISKVALLVILLLSGCATAFVTLSVVTPTAPGLLRLDYFDEIQLMKLILNIGLPLALLATVALAWVKIRTRAFHLFLAGLTVVSVISIFACALAVWSGLVSIHGNGIHLWSQIWWSWG